MALVRATMAVAFLAACGDSAAPADDSGGSASTPSTVFVQASAARAQVFRGDTVSGRIGEWSMALVDPNCDGQPELFVGEPARNRVHAVLHVQDQDEDVAIDQAAARLDRPDLASFGFRVTNAGDITGDGCDELVIGAPSANDFNGAAVLMEGSAGFFTGQTRLASILGEDSEELGWFTADGGARLLDGDSGGADWVFTAIGNQGLSLFMVYQLDATQETLQVAQGLDVAVAYAGGAFVANAGDTDGDGRDDLLYADFYNQAWVLVLSEQIVEGAESDAPLVIVGDADLDWYSLLTMVDDINDDGRVDVLSIGYRYDGGILEASVIDLFSDLPGLERPEPGSYRDAADAVSLRAEVQGLWGYARGAAMFDSPGGRYLALGMSNHPDLTDPDDGAVILIAAERLRAPDADLAQLMRQPDYVLLGGDQDGFGSSIVSADGQLLVGAPFDDTLATDGGAVYRFEGDPADWPTVDHDANDWQQRVRSAPSDSARAQRPSPLPAWRRPYPAYTAR